ncbi:hypothetical protein, partial [Chamaesiphon sp.]|uniref:hypothetical protein n=1 Tax=Chamaesiphon sp. TaxID=2814140 RepID=UPI003593964B
SCWIWRKKSLSYGHSLRYIDREHQHDEATTSTTSISCTKQVKGALGNIVLTCNLGVFPKIAGEPISSNR